MTSDYEKELLKGIKVEEEHISTFEWLRQCFRDDVMPSAHALYYHIAMDHLKEKSDYYAVLEKAGL
jgi:hypothetical protein